jgi:hypothetical protein
MRSRDLRSQPFSLRKPTPIPTPIPKIFIFRLRFQLRKTPKLSIENEQHLKYFTIELEAIHTHTQKDELTNE